MIQYTVFFIYVVIIVVLLVGGVRREGYVGEVGPLVISDMVSGEVNGGSRIPRIIWMYWDGDKSLFVEKCIESWRVKNRDHRVIVLDRDNIGEYLTGIDIGGMRHAGRSVEVSDYVRLLVLERYGGIWVDASTVCNKSVNEWVHRLSPRYEYVGFMVSNRKYMGEFRRRGVGEPYLGEDVRRKIMIESWFMAVERGSEFIRRWCKEFMGMNGYRTRGEYVEAKRREGVDMSRMVRHEYYAMYISGMKVIQDGYPLERIKLYDALSTGYYYYMSGGGEEENIRFMERNEEIFRRLEMVKFNSGMRGYIERNRIGLDFLFE